MATPKKKHLIELMIEAGVKWPEGAEYAAPQSMTIEQLTADYHAKAAEADRLQAVADDALKAADDALLALEKAGELIGLVITIDIKPMQVAQPAEQEQPEITDWRDLRVGDVVEYVHGTVRSREGKQGEVCEIDESDSHNRVRVMFNGNEDERFWCSKFRFIRRP